MTVPDHVVQGLASGLYIDTITAADRFKVAPARIHDWRRRQLVDLLRHDDGTPVLVPGRGGARDVWVTATLDAVNTAVTSSGRGRPRTPRTETT